MRGGCAWMPMNFRVSSQSALTILQVRLLAVLVNSQDG